MLILVMVAGLTTPAPVGASPPLRGEELQEQISFNAAEGLQRKIEGIKAKKEKTKREFVNVSEVEVESYVMFLLQQKKIPAKMEWVDVQFTPGNVATNVQLTLGPNTMGNYVVDKIIQGTHTLWVKGKFEGAGGRGKFDLESVRVDRLPVPVFLAEVVFNRLVKPMLPQADIRQPFQLPFGISSLTILPGKSVVLY